MFRCEVLENWIEIMVVRMKIGEMKRKRERKRKPLEIELIRNSDWPVLVEVEWEIYFFLSKHFIYLCNRDYK